MKNNSKNLNLFQSLDDEQLGKITGGAFQFIQNTASGALYYNTKTHKYQYQQTRQNSLQRLNDTSLPQYK